MQQTAIILPVAAQVALTVAVLIALGPARAQSMRELNLRLDDPDVRIGKNDWNEQAVKVANNYRNQFELPVLFYVAAVLALQAGVADTTMIALAWAFVASRIVHTLIHIGPNVVMWRGLAFLAGFLVLVAMWVRLVLHVL